MIYWASDIYNYTGIDNYIVCPIYMRRQGGERIVWVLAVVTVMDGDSKGQE